MRLPIMVSTLGHSDADQPAQSGACELNIFGTLVVVFQRALKLLAICRLSGSRRIPAFCSVLKVWCNSSSLYLPAYPEPRNRGFSDCRWEMAKIAKPAKRTYCEQRTNSVHCLPSVDSGGAARPRCRGVESRP